MKIFAIRNKDNRKKDLGYLFYYDSAKEFYIELPENANPWETPLLLSIFAEKCEYSINSYWSKKWIEQRIVPTDRQNIGQILRDNNLATYDEFKLLMLSSGKCEQDDYFLVPLKENDLPEDIKNRFLTKIDDVVPLNNNCLLLFLRNNSTRYCNLDEYMEKNSRFSILANNNDIFKQVSIQVGGYGIKWDNNLYISDTELYKLSSPIPISPQEIKSYTTWRVINTAEARRILNCSRQYINELVKNKRLHPVKVLDNDTLFHKSEIEKLTW